MRFYKTTLGMEQQILQKLGVCVHFAQIGITSAARWQWNGQWDGFFGCEFHPRLARSVRLTFGIHEQMAPSPSLGCDPEVCAQNKGKNDGITSHAQRQCDGMESLARALQIHSRICFM